MSEPRPPRPLFLDTGALYARFDADDERHGRAQRLFERIRSGKRRFRPLYTSRFVIGELATLLERKTTHADAVRAVNAIRESEAILILDLSDEGFDRTCESFAKYDDQSISFVDHTTAILAAKYEIEHVFAFDSDFETLGLTTVPEG
ncbi:type II toxin-antitoxin system VapC family toxin [Natranaeroarchaeum aerophilus]|uniref:PIN domain-containing protein n=1 Tax=Natranaeroarchaeum aerophilus TaxID=2917711 RepID=A0AAE3FRM9_9EURY|nr:PIN domain-containing protein [Natranaeroarchaeum aerophilus]MCL9814074.1 PIN domain-containing protein [Natranaeroarchaeum aerophilus]